MASDASDSVHSTPILDGLLAEVIALANQLRKSSAMLHRPDRVASAALDLLMALLQEGPRTVPQIARGRFTSRQNIQVIVDRLMEQGWVELAGNPAHKKSPLVRLTEGGRGMLAAVLEREAQHRRSLEAAIPPAEAATALEVLRRLRGLLAESLPAEPVTAKPTQPAAPALAALPVPVEEPVTEEMPVSLL